MYVVNIISYKLVASEQNMPYVQNRCLQMFACDSSVLRSCRSMPMYPSPHIFFVSIFGHKAV